MDALERAIRARCTQIRSSQSVSCQPEPLHDVNRHLEQLRQALQSGTAVSVVLRTYLTCARAILPALRAAFVHELEPP